VWLIVTDRVHVDEWGVFVATPSVSAEKAAVRVATTVRNGTDGGRDVELRTSLVSAARTAVSRGSVSHAIEAGEAHAFEQVLEVAAPAPGRSTSPRATRA